MPIVVAPPCVPWLATLVLPQDSVDLDAVASLLRDLGMLWRDSTDEEWRDIARACFERVWVDLDARAVVAVQMKSTLQPLRSVLIYETGTDSSATCVQMRTG